ncbi:MAG: hypothetical protein PUG80_03185, partial [Eubacteriales bacterium]|nr:hypothetical protein [Eubacteriales bacterium]
NFIVDSLPISDIFDFFRLAPDTIGFPVACLKGVIFLHKIDRRFCAAIRILGCDNTSHTGCLNPHTFIQFK